MRRSCAPSLLKTKQQQQSSTTTTSTSIPSTSSSQQSQGIQKNPSFSPPSQINAGLQVKTVKAANKVTTKSIVKEKESLNEKINENQGKESSSSSETKYYSVLWFISFGLTFVSNLINLSDFFLFSIILDRREQTAKKVNNYFSDLSFF